MIEDRQIHDAIDRFAGALASGDVCALRSAIDDLNREPFRWRDAMQYAAKVPVVSSAAREVFTSYCIQRGRRLRNDVQDDCVLTDGLRNLLSPYAGGDRILYRGEEARNLRDRTYGACWSESAEAARLFAIENRGALLWTAAPACAIVSAFDTSEGEYIVDRRLLGAVNMLESFLPSDDELIL